MNGPQSVWSERAQRYGRRAAVNLRFLDEDLQRETERVEGILFPLLGAQLTRSPQRVLDYGCGWGRFTADLAAHTQAALTIGYDPTPELIAMAQQTAASGVSFVTGPAQRFFDTLQAPFDLIWIHAVLGGIGDEELAGVAAALVSALAPGGMLFFVEDTAPVNAANAFWRVREERRYVDVFGALGIAVSAIGTMPSAFGETKSIFFARKPA